MERQDAFWSRLERRAIILIDHSWASSKLRNRWTPRGRKSRPRANCQLFLTELTTGLDLPVPEPAEADDEANAYCFERRVALRHGGGSESYGYIDLHRRGSSESAIRFADAFADRSRSRRSQ